MGVIKSNKKQIEPFKILGLLIIFELLISGIVILIDYNSIALIDGELFINSCSVIAKELYVLSVLQDSVILLIISFGFQILKFICAIGVLKRIRCFSLFATFLYLSEFIGALYIFSVNANDANNSSNNLAICFIFLLEFLVCFFLFGFYILDDRNLSKKFFVNLKKNTKTVILACFIFTTLVSITVIGFSFTNKNKIIATAKEIETVNRCYEYSEKYLYEKLPQDVATLEFMKNDIDSVIETDTFKRAFNQSKYQEKFIETRKLSKTDDDTYYYGPVIEKSAYVTDLIFLKCKILLALDENDEFFVYYDRNSNCFSVITELFFVYVANNLDNFSEDDILVIDKLCRDILKSDDTQKNKCSAWTTLVKLYSSDSDYENEIKPEMTELQQKYISEYDFAEYLKLGQKLSETKDGLYMLKHS